MARSKILPGRSVCKRVIGIAGDVIQVDPRPDDERQLWNVANAPVYREVDPEDTLQVDSEREATEDLGQRGELCKGAKGTCVASGDNMRQLDGFEVVWACAYSFGQSQGGCASEF